MQGFIHESFIYTLKATQNPKDSRVAFNIISYSQKHHKSYLQHASWSY